MKRSRISLLLACVSSAALGGGGVTMAAEASAADQTARGEEVLVTAPRGEVKARKVQQDALVIVNVQSAETIAKYPDYNAAEALGRIPGVSMISDTGEGRFVSIRGIDSNLNGATFGGVVLLNQFPAGTSGSGGGRAVEFDTVPSGAIDGIVVYKTLSPDREAEGLGGQIDITPRSSKNLSKPFFEATLGAGYENLHNQGGPYEVSLAAGARFGFAGGHLVVQGRDVPQGVPSGFVSNPTPFSIVVWGSRKDDRRGIDDTEPSYANDGPPCGVTASGACDQVLGRVDFRRYDYNRRRSGYGTELGFNPNDDHSYFARMDVFGYAERAHKNHWYANFSGSPSAPDANGFVTDSFQPQADLVDLNQTFRNTVAAIGGKDRFGDLAIDYRAAYSRSTFVEDYYNEARFRGPKGVFYGKYNTTRDNNRYYYKFFNDASLTTPFDSTNTANYYDPAHPNVSLSSFYENDVDQEFSYVLNAKKTLNFGDIKGEVKAGLSARIRTKDVSDFGGFASVAAALSSVSGNAAAPGNAYYYGWYPPAPYADISKVRALVNSNIPSLAPSIGRDFNDKENVYAGYLMYTGDMGPLGFLAGARVENTQATYGNYFNGLGSFVRSKNNYTNIFPTVQVKYEFQPNLQMRATYSTGIGRPGFTQAGGNAGVDFTTSPRPQETIGNKNLKPTTGNNFDLDIEYYTTNGGIFQVGVFDKEFTNYIFRSAQLKVTDPVVFAGAPGNQGDIISFFNESAYARGIELAAHQQFAWLPGWWKGFGADANLTLVDSRFREYSADFLNTSQGTTTAKDQFNQLPGTANITWNAALFYEYYGILARISAEYIGKNLYAVNGDKTIDQVTRPELHLDWTSSYKFTPNLTGYFNVKNILNTPLRYTDGQQANRIQQIEYYGQTYEVGVRAKF